MSSATTFGNKKFRECLITYFSTAKNVSYVKFENLAVLS